MRPSELWMRFRRRCPVCSGPKHGDWEAKLFGVHGEKVCYECGLWALSFDAWDENAEVMRSIDFARKMHCTNLPFPPLSDYAKQIYVSILERRL